MGSISRGFRLAKASWGVVRSDRELLWLPLISMVCSLAVMAVFALGMAGIGLPGQGQKPSAGIYVLGALALFTVSFIGIFFNAAVVATAMGRLKGEPTTIREGLAVARRHVGPILLWALVTTTIGMILRNLQERSGLLGRIVFGLVGIAWTVLTFFVVPVLIFEDVGVGQAIKRSAHIFKERWGEQFVGTATIGVAVFLVALPVLLLCAMVAAAVPVLGIGLLVLGFIAMVAVSGALSGVFNAALYRFATTGDASGAFSAEDLAGTFKPRRGQVGAVTMGALPSAPGAPSPPPPPLPPARPDVPPPAAGPDQWS